MNKKIEKVLLLSPPVLASKIRMDINPYPPLGLGYIAATLKQMDIEVKIVDCYLEGKEWGCKISWDDETDLIGIPWMSGNSAAISQYIYEFKPDMIGITQMFSRQTRIIDNILNNIKTNFPEIITVLGGAHASAMPEYCLQNENIDYFIIGEGETGIKDLIFDLTVRGRTFAPEYGYNKFIQDLDQIPFPDWEAMQLTKYFGNKASHGYRKKERFAPVITSRGCPIGCTFCTAHCVWGKKYRKRSVPYIISELWDLKHKYGVEEIMFEDDNLTLDKKRAKQLFKEMEVQKFVWDTPNGVSPWTLDEEMLLLMKASGCYRVNMAIESASTRVRQEVIKKPLDIVYATKMIQFCQKINLDVGIFLVIGMPTETEEERQLSYDFCKSQGIYFPHISIATPYPGSDLYKQLYDEKQQVDEGFLESLHIRNKLVTPKIHESLANAEKTLLRQAITHDPFHVVKNTVRAFVNNPLKTLKRAGREIW